MAHSGAVNEVDADERPDALCRSRIVRTQQELGQRVVDRWSSLCAMVAGRVAALVGAVPAGFDAERWVMEALTRALEAAEDLPDDDAAHQAFIAERSDHLAVVARNLAIDDWRTQGSRRSASPDALEDWAQRRPASDDPADQVVEQIDSERRRRALAVVLRVLASRAGSSAATAMTPEQWHTVQVYATVRRRTRDSSTAPPTDQEMHAEQVRDAQRAREDWRRARADHRAGYTRRARDGIRVATAEALGVTPNTVANRLTALSRAVRFTRYVAGVLGHRGSLNHPACIARNLDVADTWPLAGYGDERALLLAAADAVRTTEAAGTRVDAAQLALIRPRTVTAQSVHVSESLYIEHTRAISPNCVARCAAHTRSGAETRATEI